MNYYTITCTMYNKFVYIQYICYKKIFYIVSHKLFLWICANQDTSCTIQNLYILIYILYKKMCYPTDFLHENVLFDKCSVRKYSIQTLSKLIYVIQHIFYRKICYPTHFLYENALSNTISMDKYVTKHVFYTRILLSNALYIRNCFRHQNVLPNTYLIIKISTGHIYIWKHIIHLIFCTKMCFWKHFYTNMFCLKQFP